MAIHPGKLAAFYRVSTSFKNLHPPVQLREFRSHIELLDEQVIALENCKPMTGLVFERKKAAIAFQGHLFVFYR